MADDFRDILEDIRKNAEREKAQQAPENTSLTKPKEAIGQIDETKDIEDYGGQVKVRQDVEQAKCPSCGANTVYDPTDKVLKCPYCQTNVEIREGLAAERELTFEQDVSAKWHGETRVFRCANCGAETVFDKAEFAKKCVFCGSSSVTSIEDLEGVRPNAIVPFALDKTVAIKAYRNWVKKKTFCPRSFKRNAKEVLNGVYCPSWTFDSHTFSRYAGVVGDYYYVTVGSGKNRHTEQRIRYRNVSGTHASSFDDVHVNSGKQINDKNFDKLKPFYTQQSVNYNANFLAGFTAEHYTRTLNDGWQNAKSRIDGAIKSQIRSSLRCDVVQYLNVNTAYNDKTFKYLMLPIYVCGHQFKSVNYPCFINGVSGKIVGKTPVSPLRVLWAVLFGVAVVAAIAICAYFFT